MTARPVVLVTRLPAIIPSSDPAFGAADAPDPEEAVENALPKAKCEESRRRRAEAEMRRALQVPDSLRADPDVDTLPQDAPIFRVRVAVRPNLHDLYSIPLMHSLRTVRQLPASRRPMLRVALWGSQPLCLRRLSQVGRELHPLRHGPRFRGR